ncbi:RagB/SusD family nutrient uptake outer membrane protein [Pseudoflavitalea sp. G-6-1-2]|uniref:RagB/SusD family nutrient uptake outer membrane protein n=1 Tax=Pseudoflavitalea sp. G-6-1-2 TaxID=2728841 RepID=UPI001469DB52|nr:RagB/SusD family nutrient uptake outer membrane protein [Pseudoflavitalea sp. G-6-1-2]NML20398.1 RagB/SusD family nutrient uptake outer membrane protein [Pseudoflavitalea sp. G-6-1-2]
MKTIHKILLIPALVGSMVMTGCKKDYLNAEPSEQISFEELIELAKKDPSILDGSVAGLYSTMYNPGTGGTTDHDDFGQKGYDIYSDMMSGDMAMPSVSYGWYGPVVRLTSTIDYTSAYNYKPWRYYYLQVMGANSVMDILGGDDFEPTDAVRKRIMGQALAMRAYAYFYLSQLYSQKGYGDGTEKIFPIYRTSKGVNQPKSTAKQVWDLMISDLNRAITYLNGFERKSKDQIDVTVAKGLLAYVLSSRGTNEDLQKVVTLTNDITNAYPLTTRGETVATFSQTGTLLNPQSGFNSVRTPSWIWGVDLTLAANLDLASWWGQMDVFTYSYASVGDYKTIDNGLQSKFRSDDIRKDQFDEEGIPVNKFFDPARKEEGQRIVVTDYVYMRADEFQLLNAETYARLNDDANAKTSLKKLLAERIGDISYVEALSGDALKKEIYLQTRLELWGEGKAYLAMKRNKQSVTRGTNHLYLPGKTWAYDDKQLTFPIPQAEVLNNPVLDK